MTISQWLSLLFSKWVKQVASTDPDTVTELEGQAFSYLTAFANHMIEEGRAGLVKPSLVERIDLVLQHHVAGDPVTVEAGLRTLIEELGGTPTV